MHKVFIANPIFDTVFKHLMENNRIARFFVETIIDCPVESITVKPQDYTYFRTTRQMLAKSGLTSEEIEKIENLSIFRCDFVAVIRTPEGYRKVLIEIQKARNIVDLMRFRNYLGEQYKRKDAITVDGKEEEEPLPIITIYLLGFKLPETDAIVIRVSRTYHDMITDKDLDVKSEFIECLTHDSYVVQIPRIEGKTRTRLEQLLSVFEQNYFIDDKGIRKAYHYDVDDENIRSILELLYHTGADPEKQKEMEDEWWSNELWEEVIVKKDKKIALQKQEIEEKIKEIEENKKEIEEKDKENEELKRQLAVLQKMIKTL
jgi:hypothetical protein